MTGSAIQDRHDVPYVLYHHTYSICSIMVRYTLALRGAARSAAEEMMVEERVVEISKGEQLTEAFLCDVNPKGQVPVLSNADLLPGPLPDSLDITIYIGERHGSLLPTGQRDQILRLLRELHSINYFSLTFGNKPAAALGMKSTIENVMAKPDLSERYRSALKYKLQVHENEKMYGLNKQSIEKEIEKTKLLFSELENHLHPEAGPWMFGLQTATALDGNLIPFIARLRDIGMSDLVPKGIIKYADAAMAKHEWSSVMEGRSTIPTV